MKIEDKTITICLGHEDFDEVISKLESLSTLLQETMDTLKETRNSSLTKSQAF